MKRKRNSTYVRDCFLNAFMGITFSSHARSSHRIKQQSQSTNISRNQKSQQVSLRCRYVTPRTTHSNSKSNSQSSNSDNDGDRRKTRKDKPKTCRISTFLKFLWKILRPSTCIFMALSLIKEGIELIQFYLPKLMFLLELLNELII